MTKTEIYCVLDTLDIDGITEDYIEQIRGIVNRKLKTSSFKNMLKREKNGENVLL